MYFAFSPTEVSVAVQIEQALRALRVSLGEKPIYLYALLDGVFDEALLAAQASIAQQMHSLYANTSLQGLGHAAPHFLAAPHDPAELMLWITHWISTCSAKPMLSFIASAVPATGLKMRFRSYLMANTPDGMTWPLRWADTRVLPIFMEVLNPAQRAHLLAPLHVWWAIHRSGGLIQWEGEGCSHRRVKEFETLALTEAALGKLVDLTEADAILANIYDFDPVLLQRLAPANCHARVSEFLVLASEHGILSAPDRQHFSQLALSLQADFIHHPSMRALLQKTRAGLAYQSEIAALPHQFWQATETI